MNKPRYILRIFTLLYFSKYYQVIAVDSHGGNEPLTHTPARCRY